MATASSSPLSKDLANILSRMKTDIEPPYKKFRSRSEENFYSINALDSDSEDGDLYPIDFHPGEITTSESFMNATGNNQYLNKSNNGSNTNNIKGPLELHDNNNLTSLSTDAHYTVRNIKQELGFQSSASINSNKGDDNNDHAAVEVNGSIPTTDKENIDYSVHTILQDFKQRQESNVIIRSFNQDKVYSLDDYDVGDFYMEDDGVGHGDSDCGIYPISRYNRVYDLTEYDNISDILNRTLDTITEESEDSDIAESTVGSSYKSNSAEPRSDCNSLVTTPRASIKTTTEGDGHSDVPDDPSSSAVVADVVSNTNFQWDNQLHSGYCESEVLSEEDDDASTVSESNNIGVFTTKFNSEIPISMLQQGHHQQDTGQKTDYVNKLENYNLSGGSDPSYVRKLENYNLSGGSSSSSSTLKSSGTDITPKENQPVMAESKLNTVSNEEQSINMERVDSENREKERLWYEDDYQFKDHRSASEDSYYSARSSLDIPDKDDTHRLEVKSTDTLSNSMLKVDSSFMFSRDNKPVEWDTAELNSEIAESVVLSDFVSDTESLYSRTGSVVSDYPDAIEAITAHLRYKNNNNNPGTSSSTATKSDVQLCGDGDTAQHSDSCDTPTGISPLDNTVSTLENAITKLNEQNIGINITENSLNIDLKDINSAPSKPATEKSPSSVTYDHFNPVYSSSQFSLSSQDQSVNSAEHRHTSYNGAIFKSTSHDGLNERPLQTHTSIKEIPVSHLINNFHHSVNNGKTSDTGYNRTMKLKQPFTSESDSTISIPDISTLPRINVSEPPKCVTTISIDNDPDGKGMGLNMYVMNERNKSKSLHDSSYEKVHSNSSEGSNGNLRMNEELHNNVTFTHVHKTTSVRSKEKLTASDNSKSAGRKYLSKDYEIKREEMSSPLESKRPKLQVDEKPIETSTPKFDPANFTFSVDQKEVEIVRIEHTKLYGPRHRDLSPQTVKYRSSLTEGRKSPVYEIKHKTITPNEKLYEKVDKNLYIENKPKVSFPKFERPTVELSNSQSETMRSPAELPKEIVENIEPTPDPEQLQPWKSKDVHTSRASDLTLESQKQDTLSDSIVSNTSKKRRQPIENNVISSLDVSLSKTKPSQIGRNENSLAGNPDTNDSEIENPYPMDNNAQFMTIRPNISIRNQKQRHEDKLPRTSQSKHQDSQLVENFNRVQTDKATYNEKQTDIMHGQFEFPRVDSKYNQKTVVEVNNEPYPVLTNNKINTQSAYGNYKYHQSPVNTAPTQRSMAESQSPVYNNSGVLEKNGVHLTLKQINEGNRYGIINPNETDDSNSISQNKIRPNFLASNPTQYSSMHFPRTIRSTVNYANEEDDDDDDYEKPVSIYPKSINGSTRELVNTKPILPLKNKAPLSPKLDVATNIIEQGRLEDEQQQIMRCTHNYENVYTEQTSLKPKTCTAVATSTALARKDFMVMKSDEDNLGDAVVSAVASAEATGESPYVAVARATARAATIATATAAKGASKQEDNRDVTVMISTSCTIQDKENNEISKDSQDVITALKSDANVAVYTRIVPNPNAIVNQYSDRKDDNEGRVLKVSIEQPVNVGGGKQTIEISLPSGTTDITQLITESVNKILKTQNNATVADNNNTVTNSNDDNSKTYSSIQSQEYTNNVQTARNNNNTEDNNINDSMDNSSAISSNVSEQKKKPSSKKSNSVNTIKVENVNAFNDSGRLLNGSIANTGGVNSNNALQSSDIHVKLYSETNNSLADRSCNTGCYNVRAAVIESDHSQIADTHNNNNDYHVNEGYSNSNQQYNKINRESVQNDKFQQKLNKSPDELKNHYLEKNYKSIENHNSVNSNQSSSRLPPYVPSKNRMKINEARQQFLNDQDTQLRQENKVKVDISNNSVNTLEINTVVSKEKSKKKKKKKKHKKGHDDYQEVIDKKSKENKVEQEINVTNMAYNSNNQWESDQHRDTDTTNNNMSLQDSGNKGVKYHTTKAGHNNIEQDMYKTCSSSKDNNNPVYRTQSFGTLPKEFFSHGGSRTSLIETDLDTGISTQRPLVYETDLDILQHKSRSKSVSNIHKTSRSSSAVENNNADNFDRTQSMTYLSKQNPNDKPSEHEERVNRSLSKLHIPVWYNSQQRQAVQLENTHRAVTHNEPNYKVVSPAHGDGVSAMIVKTKPVVIQHRVNTPATMIANSRHKVHSMTLRENEFRLPSSKWKKDSHSFKPIPIKALHEVGAVQRGDHQRPAKEAYLKLKAEQEQKNVHSEGTYKSNTVHSLDKSGQVSYNKPTTKQENVPYGCYNQGQFIDVSKLTKDPNMDTTHTYVNIDCSYEENPIDVPPPLPPRRQYNDVHMDLRLSPGSKKTRSETSSSPDALFDSAYDSLSKGHTDDSYISTTSNQFSSSYKANDKISTFPKQNNKDFSYNNNTNTDDSSGIQTFSDHSTQQKYFENKGGATINLKLSNNRQIPQNKMENKQFKRKSKPLNTDIVEPLVEKAKASPNWRVAQFGNDLENDLELLQYPNSPGSRKGINGQQLSPMYPSRDQCKENRTADKVKVKGQTTKPLTNSLNTIINQDATDKDSSIDTSKGNTTFEDMLDGLLGIPSLNSSMMDTSRASFRKNSDNISPSAVNPESPLQTVYRLLGNGQMPDKSRDSEQSFLNTTISTTGNSPKFPQFCDSSKDTLDSSSNIFGNNFDGNSVSVKCRNSKCKKEVSLEEAKLTYKTCHNCYTYYCSRDCRKAHWERHKKKCVFSRVSSHCKHVIKKINSEVSINEEVSKAARTGYIHKGRGSVVVSFSSLEKADNFLKEGLSTLEHPLAYISMSEIEESRLFGEQAFELLDFCRTYNPEVKYILEVIMLGCDQVPMNQPTPRHKGPAIKKCSKIRLAGVKKQTKTKPKATVNVSDRLNDNDTLILTAVPGSEFTENMEERKAREICFNNIQSKLRHRGISLRHQYPEVYTKLCLYVSDKKEFAPITLFPIDKNTGKSFMCLIMPNSEPDVEWKRNPGLMQELGLHSEV